MDDLFRIPGTGRRIGLEPLIGLIPVVGDLATGAVGAYLIARALRFRLPVIVVVRMVFNTLLDVVIGGIPLLGDVFDFYWKGNSRNMELFREYAEEPGRSTRRHYIFFAAVLGLILLVILAVAAAVIWLIRQILS